MKTEVQLIKRMKENDRFVRADFEHIRKLYANQYIAVDAGKVIGHATTMELLKKHLEAKKANLMPILIEYIPQKGQVILF